MNFSNPRRTTTFLVLFTLLNLGLIPLMSLYGLTICPVLSHSGFWVGCSYTAAYIITVLLINTTIMIFLFRNQTLIKPWILLSSYLLASVIAILILQALFNVQHISSVSRAPEVLVVASILLSITQSYGLSWVLEGRVFAQGAPATDRVKWRSHLLRVTGPMFVTILILSHFMFRQIGQDGSAVVLGGSFLLGFLAVWLMLTYFFHFLSERDNLLNVSNHLEEFKRENFHHRSDASGAWGIWLFILGQLNYLGKVLVERGRLVNNFSQFVTRAVVQESLISDKLRLGGEAREVTVIMSDIREFTALSENLPPEKTVRLLNTYFSSMIEIALEHDVIIDKFIGDGILAYVSPSGSAESQNARAIRAAVAMIKRLADVNVSLITQGLPPLRIGIGVNRGEVVMGMIGGESKLQHTIIGDPVNRTARLEALCKELGVAIVISKDVLESLSQNLRADFRNLGPVQIKGISEPVEVFGAY